MVLRNNAYNMYKSAYGPSRGSSPLLKERKKKADIQVPNTTEPSIEGSLRESGIVGDPGRVEIGDIKLDEKEESGKSKGFKAVKGAASAIPAVGAFAAVGETGAKIGNSMVEGSEEGSVKNTTGNVIRQTADPMANNLRIMDDEYLTGGEKTTAIVSQTLTGGWGGDNLFGLRKNGKKGKIKAAKAKKQAEYNKKRDAILESNRQITARNKDRSDSQRVARSGDTLDSTGAQTFSKSLSYRNGGLLYKTIENVVDIPTEDVIKEPRRITQKFSNGGTLKDTKKKLVFKLPSNNTPLFRRGGKVDVAKTNVIVAGPSHEDSNNTSVKGDKGLPIVKGNKKVAEIESKELIINKDSTAEIEKLMEEAKTNPEAKAKLGALIEKELSENTYDYDNVLA